ncbi:MAG TPA: tetratricopeptide repeat protein [Pirellulaceae bacterium]|nr:tetratricopeptide repeat protein [Pirellulaceae bacterium]
MTPLQTLDSETTPAENLADWLQRNSRLVGTGAVLVVVAGAGYWFFLRSAEIKRVNAERGLNQAKQSLAAGNAALAATDLQRVTTRYRGTPAGGQAAMLLAQLHYEQARFAEGVQVLEAYQNPRTARADLSAVWSLTADGQTAQGQLDQAAESYRKAAESAAMPGARALFLAKSARTLMAAGKNAEARAVWESLVDDPDAAVVQNEARIRLGELMAQPAGRS